MADIETSIGIGLDTSNALAAIKNLQREISAFHTALAKSSSSAAVESAKLQKDLLNSINATGQFSASMTTVKSTTESFTNALEKNKLSMGEYFRYAGGASKNFSKFFSKEFDTINKVARERVKDLQTQYIQLGRDAGGALQAIKVRPLVLDMNDLGTQTQIAAQKQQIFNQLLKQGSTNLLNFGKNTQWAGRQLMVGFTIPLSIFGTTAARTFMELEKQAIKFKRVYGELFTSPQETESMIKALQELSLEFTKYGVAVEKTMSLAADAAAMGKTGQDLLAQVTEANRLAVLGNVEQSQALETTISVTNAFGVAAEDLAKKIDFLNAVENQTVTSIEDLTVAIPKAGPVIQQLGGNVEDLAFFLTAMKEGGINASEGANALKSGLASLINPTQKASEFLRTFGINIQGIVNANKGDIKGIVIDFAQALDTLDPLNRAQAIEQLFGKFQFSRLSTLFQNVIAEGTQAERVLALTNATVQELAQLSEKELGSVADSTTFRFQKAVEELRAAIAPVGEQFLKAVTPVLEFAADILNKFNSLNEGVKNFVVVGGALIAGLGPVFLMTFGLIANGIANIIKGFAAVRGLFLQTKDSSTMLGEQFNYMTQEQLEAAAVASSLERAHMQLEQRFTSEATAIQNLIAVYERASRAKERFSTIPGVARATGGMKLSSGIISVPGPKGAGDIVPAMLAPGEAVIPADAARKYAPLIEGMISGNIPGYKFGKKSDKVSLYGGSTTMTSGGGVPFAPGNVAGSKLGMSPDFFRSNDFTQMFTAGAIGAAFRTNEPAGSKISSRGLPTEKLIAYLDESEIELKNIVDILRKSEEELTSAGKNIESFDDITANAKERLQKVFADMEKAGGRKAAVARAVRDEMLMPTKESIEKSRLSELRSRAVKVQPATGKLENTVFRVGEQSRRGSAAAVGAAKALFPETVKRLSGPGAKSPTFAHLNELRVGGPQMPLAGGVLGLQNAALKQQAIDALGTASARQATLFPEGKLVNKTEVAKAAKDVANIVNTEVEKNTKDIYEVSRDRNSPHKLAAEDGKDDAVAYENAKQRQLRKSRRVRSETVNGQTVISNPNAVANEEVLESRRGPRRVIRPGDREVRQQSEATKANVSAIGQQTAKIQSSSVSLSRYNSLLMNGTFAISSLTGVLSLFGGQFAELNQQIFGISTALFALMQITQLLTQAKFAELVQSRLASANIAVRAAKVFGSGAIAAQGFVGGISRAALFVSRFLGPVGLVITGLTALAGIIALINGAQEEQKKKINGLGNAAYLTAEKMAKAGELLGFTPQTSGFGQNIVAGTAAGSSGIESSAIAQLRSNEDFTTAYADQISALRDATKAEAEQVLTSVANQLFAANATKEQVQAFVKAIAQEAGQTSVSFDFVNIDFTTQGKDQIVSLARDAAKDYSDEFGKNIKLGYNAAGVIVQEMTYANQEGLQAIQTFAGTTASSFQALKDGLQNGLISVDDFNLGLSQVTQTLTGLDEGQLGLVLPELYKKLKLEETMEGITSIQDQLLVLQADAAGVTIPQDQLNALKSSKKDIDSIKLAARVRKQLTDQVKKQAQAQLDNNNKVKEEATLSQSIIDAKSLLTERIALLQQQSDVYQKLIDQGYDSEIAFKLAGDSALAAGISAALGANAAVGAWEDLKPILDQYIVLDKKSSTAGGTKSIFAQAKENLEKQRKEILDNISAFNKLRKAGLDVASAMSAAQDPTLAAALASEKVGTAKWKQLIALVNKFNASAAVGELRRLINENIVEAQTSKATQEIEKYLTKAGYSVEQIGQVMSQIGDNPDILKKFVSDLKDGKINSKLIKEYLLSVKNININLSIDEMEQKVSQAFSDISEGFAAQKERIDLDFELGTNVSGKNKINPLTGLPYDTTAINKSIKQAQEYIAERQYSIDDYEYQLQGIQDKEDAINKSYDDRIKALDKVKDINDKIANKQKDQLDVASALSRGDIAAAASAAQQLQANEAARALEEQKKTLEAAKTAELAGVRSANGLSRIEIEEKIKTLKTEIAKKEEETLEPQQRALELAEGYRDAANNSLTYLNKNESEWKKIEAGVKLAKTEAEGYKKAIEDAIKLIPQLQSAYALSGSGSNIDPKQARIDQLNAQIKSNRDIVNKDKSISAQDKQLMAQNVKLINELRDLTGDKTTKGGYAYGGFVSGPGTSKSDSIPAWLSDGEFVINAKSVKALGIDFLNMLNAPGFAAGGSISKKLQAVKKSESSSKSSSSNKFSIEDIGRGLANPMLQAPEGVSYAKDITTSFSNVQQGKAGVFDYLTLATAPFALSGFGIGSGAKAVKAATKIPRIKPEAYRPTGDLLQSIKNIGSYAIGKVKGIPEDQLVPITKIKQQQAAEKQNLQAVQDYFDEARANQGITSGGLQERLKTRKELFGPTLPEAIKQIGKNILGFPQALKTAKALQKNYPKKVMKYDLENNRLYEDTELLAPLRYYNYDAYRSGLAGSTLSPSRLMAQMQRPLAGFENYSRPVQDIMASLLTKKQNFTDKLQYKVKRIKDDTIPSLSRKYLNFLEKKPLLGGIGAYFKDKKIIHRSDSGTLDQPGSLLHPRDVPIVGGRYFGPGTYFAKSLEASDKYFKDFGEEVYELSKTPTAVLRTLTSKGYIKLNKVEKQLGINLFNKQYDDPQIQELIKQGYIGIEHGDAFTNWLIGVEKGFTLKKYDRPPKKPPLAYRLRDFFGMDQFASGGMVKPKYFNAGGMALGTDVVPSMLTPGEFVMSKYAVSKYGTDTMRAINSGTFDGGSVYNYNVNVSVQSGANPNEIARAVMNQIRSVDSQRIRSNRF